MAVPNAAAIFEQNEKDKICRNDYLQTTNTVFQKKDNFKQGLLVNRIFQTKINGGTDTIEKLRESIDAESRVDKFSDVPKNAIETDLKSRASR